MVRLGWFGFTGRCGRCGWCCRRVRGRPGPGWWWGRRFRLPVPGCRLAGPACTGLAGPRAVGGPALPRTPLFPLSSLPPFPPLPPGCFCSILPPGSRHSRSHAVPRSVPLWRSYACRSSADNWSHLLSGSMPWQSHYRVHVTVPAASLGRQLLSCGCHPADGNLGTPVNFRHFWSVVCFILGMYPLGPFHASWPSCTLVELFGHHS